MACFLLSRYSLACLALGYPGFPPDRRPGLRLSERTAADRVVAAADGRVAKQIEAILKNTPGVQTYNTVVGFSLLSTVNTTYNAFYFVTLAPWDERDAREKPPIFSAAQPAARRVSRSEAVRLPPPAIPGVGTSGGVTFMLEDRSGQDIEFLAENTEKFLHAARQRPEIAPLTTTFIPDVPQVFARRGSRKSAQAGGGSRFGCHQTLQSFMGGVFVNFFNRFGRVWQVYVQAEGEFRTEADNVGQFHVRNSDGQTVPLSALVTMQTTSRAGVHSPLQRLQGGANKRHLGAWL